MVAQSINNKPKNVIAAVNFLWASLVLSLFKVFMLLPEPDAIEGFDFTNFTLFFSLGLIVLLITKISAGRNWARVTFLVMLIIGLVPAISLMFGEFSRSLVAGIISLLQDGFQVYAMYLIFTRPGSFWFSSSSKGVPPGSILH